MQANNITSITIGAIVLAICALVVVAFATTPTTYKPIGCQQELAEHQVVASIATATGRLPGEAKNLPTNTTVKANPPCK